ncbi:MAG TPA: hypothetical protein VES60_03630 [Nakamurella sp.]|nr:hypothetical protein [Nakamurella sp.]
MPMPDLDLVDDPAANTADLLIDRADSCVIGPDDADVSHVAGIVTQTWQDATDLAHQVIEDPRFASTVRAIIDAENNGLDIAEPLAQVPRDTLAGSGGRRRRDSRLTPCASQCRFAPSPVAVGIPTLPTTRPGTSTVRRTSSGTRGANTLGVFAPPLGSRVRGSAEPTVETVTG